jgi:hypothetical protein
MSLVVNDILQVDARVTHLGREAHNVFHYKLISMDAGLGYADIANHFADWYSLAVAPITIASAVLDLVTITNLTNGLDIHEQTVSEAGLITGDNAPSFVAWGFRLIRGSRLTRHGSKRFVGVSEDSTLGNEPQATIVDELNTCASKLHEGILVSGTTIDVTLQPVIVGRDLVDDSYVLNPTKINTVIGAEFTALTTQNSRKD